MAMRVIEYTERETGTDRCLMRQFAVDEKAVKDVIASCLSSS